MRSNKAKEAALKRGAAELMHPAEYELRDKPRALARVKRAYLGFCFLAYRAIERKAKVAR